MDQLAIFKIHIYCLYTWAVATVRWIFERESHAKRIYTHVIYELNIRSKCSRKGEQSMISVISCQLWAIRAGMRNSQKNILALPFKFPIIKVIDISLLINLGRGDFTYANRFPTLFS